MLEPSEGPLHARAVQFRTTRWSLVLRAGAEQLSPADERRALEELCRAYWYPIYSYIRRRGHGPEDAQDLAQGFFASLLERNGFSLADRERGRFRTFLLCALNNHLTAVWETSRRQKRGGGIQVLSLETESVEERFSREPSTEETPERAFDRRWGEVLLGRVYERLEQEALKAGEIARFSRLKIYLVEDRGTTPFTEVALELGTTEAGVKGVVRRMRARFRELLREEVAQTVDSPGDVEGELRHLVEVM